MGILILIVPLILYFFILKAVLKNYDETKRRFKKRTVFILLLTLPFWDHIIGYAVYKYLCFTSGGVRIYKTITDEQEQRDYWIDTYAQINPRYNIGSEYGIITSVLLTKDFKEHKTIHTNFCKSKTWKTYDCEKADKYIKKSNLKIYGYAKDDTHIPKNKQHYIKNSSLKSTWVVGEKLLERGYLNYCSDEYNSLEKSEKNYAYSCTNADKLIKKYNLKNVVRVPKSKYRNYWRLVKEKKTIVPFILYETYTKRINNKTNELDGEWYAYTFKNGLYIQTFSPYHPAYSYCNDGWFKGELIIPNPFKAKKQ